MRRENTDIILSEDDFQNLQMAYIAFRRHATGQETIGQSSIDYFRRLGDPVAGAYTELESCGNNGRQGNHAV